LKLHELKIENNKIADINDLYIVIVNTIKLQ
jgi:hypothetical protein